MLLGDQFASCVTAFHSVVPFSLQIVSMVNTVIPYKQLPPYYKKLQCEPFLLQLQFPCVIPSNFVVTIL